MTAAAASPARRRLRRAGVVVVALLLALTASGAVAALVGVWPDAWPQSWAQADDDDVDAPLVGDDYYASPTAVCGLLDGDDLAIALGRGYHDGVVPGMTPAFAGVPGITKCAYPREDGQGGLEIGVVYAYAEQIYTEVREQAVQRADDPDDVVAVDVGDEAFYDPVSSEMYALADGNIFAVVVGRGELERTEDRLERYRRLVETAIGRLR